MELELFILGHNYFLFPDVLPFHHLELLVLMVVIKLSLVELNNVFFTQVLAALLTIIDVFEFASGLLHSIQEFVTQLSVNNRPFNRPFKLSVHILGLICRSFSLKLSSIHLLLFLLSHQQTPFACQICRLFKHLNANLNVSEAF